jgi:tyrosyl-tRNA synthetase
MLAKESVKARVESESGISFTEFSYMLLQANDFRHLFEHHQVEMQMGGSDQWGNITAGIDLIRRRVGAAAYGLTWPLLTRSDGQKMGKSVGGALWLDPAKTSPYQFRQYWVQLPDDDVEGFLLRLTFRPVEEIADLVARHREAPERRLAQRALAGDVTRIVHGEEAARAAEEAADVLFGSDPTTASADAIDVVRSEVPVTVVDRAALAEPVGLLVTTGLASSNGDARRTLQQRGYRANGVQLGPETTDLRGVEPLHGRYVLLRKGRTSYHLVEISSASG